jgi:tetratricopeptide (TPR) repeat protein
VADAKAPRDFFISFNSADLPFAEAIDAALRAEGFSTFYHPRDLGVGGNIPIWMDEALMNSAQTLALYSPDYTKDEAIYSKAELYASFWPDPTGHKRKLIPVVLRETTFTPLIAPLSRIEVKGLTPAEAAAHIVKRLNARDEAESRDRWRAGLPLPKIFNVLYRPNPNFTGRFEALITLHQSLLARTHAAITAFAGMGGIGKTTLAAEYCHRFGGLYGGVWWIRAEQEPVMLADLQALGEKLGIASDGNIETAVRACLDRLQSLPEQWLLVYDNAPNPDAVGKWLPVGAVRCLITSRNREFGAVASVTRLDQWPDEVTADYLLTRTKRNDAAGAARLATRLGGLPLAAEQAAVYLSPRSGVSFDDYGSEITRLIKQPPPAGAKGDYPETVYAAFVKSLETVGQGNESKTVLDVVRRCALFLKSFGKIRVAQKGQIALDIVRLCSFLSPDGVHLGLLTDARGKEVLPAAFAVAMVDKFVREDALAALTTLSLLRQESGPAGNILIFHRLLLEVIRVWMGEDARLLWGEAAVRLVSRAFPNSVADEPSTWPFCASLMPHVAPLEAHATRTGAAGKSLDHLLNQAGLYLAERGDREGALALAERSVALKRLTRADEPLELAAGINNLALRHSQLGRLKEAEKAYREALEIKELRLAANLPSLAITLSNLAVLHLRRKDFLEAEALLLRVVEIDKAAHGIDSAAYGTSLGNLDSLYDEWAEQSGDVEKRRKAEHYSRQALTVTQAARGERHPETAIRHHNLAILKARLGDWADAASEAERAGAIMLSLDLAEHPHTQEWAAALVHFWQQSGQFDKAARLQSGDFSDLLPVIVQVEAEHRAWIAKDPKNRHFGPPSPFALER